MRNKVNELRPPECPGCGAGVGQVHFDKCLYAVIGQFQAAVSSNPIGPGPKAGRNYRVEVMVYDVYTTEAVVGFSATAKREEISIATYTVPNDGPPLLPGEVGVWRLEYGAVDMSKLADFIKAKAGGQ